MPGYLQRIKQLKQDGKLDPPPKGPAQPAPRGNEINELNEISLPAFGDGEPNPLGRLSSDGTESLERLIARLQKGQTWLLDQHHRWLVDDPTGADHSEFSTVWNGWWELDQQLREDYGFKGCVYGADGACPEGFPCRGCADLPTAAVVAQLALGK